MWGIELLTAFFSTGNPFLRNKSYLGIVIGRGFNFSEKRVSEKNAVPPPPPVERCPTLLCFLQWMEPTLSLSLSLTLTYTRSTIPMSDECPLTTSPGVKWLRKHNNVHHWALQTRWNTRFAYLETVFAVLSTRDPGCRYGGVLSTPSGVCFLNGLTPSQLGTRFWGQNFT